MGTLLRIPAQLLVEIEIPRGSMVKRRADGRVDFVALPSPFNYGSVLGTMAPDGDPLDVIVLGARLPRGHRMERAPSAVFGFVDGGQLDPKVVCSNGPLRAADRRAVERFFWVYARFKRALAHARGHTGRTETLGWMRWTTRGATSTVA